MVDPNYGSLQARLSNLEDEMKRVRDRLHDLEGLAAAVQMMVDAIKEMRESIERLPVTEERVSVLTSEIKNVKRALWSFTFAITGGAITFAFVAIQLVSQ